MAGSGVGSSQSAVANLEYGGIEVRQWDEMLSLTDMWRAAGGDLARQPAEWLRSVDAQKFVDALSGILNMGISQDEKLVTVTRGGRNPGTRAHWQIGLAYAKYLSPEFHMWCNTVVRERMEGRSVAVTPAGVLLTPDVRSAIGGIVKAVVGKMIAEQDAKVERLTNMVRSHQAASEKLADQVRTMIIESDPAWRRLTYRPMLEVLIEHKVGPKRRRALSQKCSRRLLRWCIENERFDGMLVGRETGRYMFQSAAIQEWLKVEGGALIAEHRAAVEGQGVLAFKKPKPVSLDDIPVEDETKH